MDITILMLRDDRLVDSHFASKAANSPFIGETLKGQVKYTICRDKSSIKTRWGVCSVNKKNRELICTKPIILKTSLSYFKDIFPILIYQFANYSASFVDTTMTGSIQYHGLGWCVYATSIWNHFTF